MKKRAREILTFAIPALMITGAWLYAGPLNPPAGPVTSTYKTLTEVEPRIAVNDVNTPGDATSHFKITQSGSYYLTSNIIGTQRAYGIQITADNVVLDLAGFSVLHSGQGLEGISTAGTPRVSITIRNGIVSAWGTGGIRLDGTGHIVEHVHARVNNGVGISVGAASIITACQASTNLSTGFSAGDGSSFDDCVASGNTGSGFVVTEGCTLTNCVAKANRAIGIDCGGGCSITGCSATDNETIGIRSVDTGLDDGGTTIANCSASGNATDGFRGSIATTFTGCSARRNTGIGFVLGFGGTATNSSASFNTGGGFAGSTGATINACSAFNNGNIGISIADSGTISNCTARANSFDGIAVANTCVVTGNSSTGNGPTATGGSGILVTGTDCRLEANSCAANNDYGIEISGAGNIIVRNTCSGNSLGNWNLAANNLYGPIMNRVGVATSAQTGNGSGVDVLSSTHPNANFSY